MLAYTVRISGVKDGSHEDFFDINGEFFESFVNSDVTNCEIKVVSVLMKDGNKLKLNLGFKGKIYNLLCDLCASETTIPVDNSISVLLHENEEELNRIFIDIYGLQDELNSDVALKDITILQEELDRGDLKSRNGELLSAKTGLPIKKDVVIKQLLSYATGCFMGRYRLDKPGLNIAHPKPTEEELSAYSYHDQTFEIDDDAIIPTMGSNSPFHDDIVARSKEFIQMVWGDESLTENLNFINESLGENIEKYLTKKFWADHKKTYKKKPIYWEFSSSNGAFKVIAYMHRMNRFTLQKIRQNYLFKQMTWLEQEIDHLEQNEATLSSTDGRRLDNLRGNLIECREYDLVLKDVSDRQIEFDLDDGVTENYKLFDGVVSKI